MITDMKQEDRELLFQDLCARLPYEVKCYPVTTKGEPNTIGGYCEVFDDFYIREVSGWFHISMIKPYLRSMDSMTEEEGHEYRMFIDCSYNDFTSESTQCVYVDKINDYLDWLNSRHFDYRGLIERKLAIKAPESMYDIK